MSSTKSWFANLSSDGSPLLSKSSHELPRWRSPSPMARSMIPPPIVQSTYLSSPRSPVPLALPVEKLLPYEDRQGELEAELQSLLDLQAAGLARGADGEDLDGPTSTGSTTPTVRSLRSTSARRAGRPNRRQPGLRSARKGIYESIVALSVLKREELHELNTRAREDEDALEKIEAWEERRQGLQEATRQVDTSEDTSRAQQLRREANSMQSEISKMELHLMEMKSKQRRLLKQAAAVENSLQAKLASYTSSLRTLEDDVQKFLSIRPADANVRPSDLEPSVWQLPPKRRNLEMAKDYWTRSYDARQRQVHEARREQKALVDGAAVWGEVLTDVKDFEKTLSASILALEDPLPTDEASDRKQELIDQLEAVLARLEAKHKLAEERKWTLLIAAIGAELEALRRGKSLILGTDYVDSIDTAVQGDGPREGDEIRDLDRSFETARHDIVREASDTDEEPGPELMFSEQRLDPE